MKDIAAMSITSWEGNLSRLSAVLSPLCTLLASCGGSSQSDARVSDSLYVTNTIVFNSDGQSSYVALLPSLGTQTVTLNHSIEFPGWSAISVSDGKLFVSDGESPTMTRFAVGADGALAEDGKVNFANHGAAYAESLFVAPDKAYVFAVDGVAWDPKAMAIAGTFALPHIEDRADGLEFSGLMSGREAVVRGNRAYVAANWANWDTYSVSEDSLIVVIDTDTNAVIDTLAVPCPYIDVGTLGDDGYVYFSNWIYSVGQTLLHDKKKACAVRLPPGKDQLDADWSLTFADVTGGREGAALRAIGNGKAIFSVYCDERAEIHPDTDPASLSDATNWKYWMLDLKTRAAQPIESIDFSVGGFSLRRVDEKAFLMVPGADYASTGVYEVTADGAATLRWTIPGWSTDLIRLR